MRFEWRNLTLFGVAMTVPAIHFIIRKTKEQVTAFAQHREELRDCDRCHSLFNHRAGTRLIIHLKTEHRIEENKAIAIVDDLYRDLLILLPRMKDTQGKINA